MNTELQSVSSNDNRFYYTICNVYDKTVAKEIHAVLVNQMNVETELLVVGEDESIYIVLSPRKALERGEYQKAAVFAKGLIYGMMLRDKENMYKYAK